MVTARPASRQLHIGLGPKRNSPLSGGPSQPQTTNNPGIINGASENTGSAPDTGWQYLGSRPGSLFRDAPEIKCPPPPPPSVASFDPSRHLRRKDIVFHPDHLVINIQWSKTIQYRERTLDIPLPRLRAHPLCPVAAVFQAYHMSAVAAPDRPGFIADTEGQVPLTAERFLSMLRRALQLPGWIAGSMDCIPSGEGGSWAYQCGMAVDTLLQTGVWDPEYFVAGMNAWYMNAWTNGIISCRLIRRKLRPTPGSMTA